MRIQNMHVQQRKFHRLVATVALVATVVLLAAPTTLAAGADVYGVGGGSINTPTGQKFIKFAFSAHTGPQGDVGSLRWTIEDPTIPVDVHVDVDCLNVAAFGTGAAGWIGGTVTRVTPESNAYGVAEGNQQLIGITDMGNPSSTNTDGFSSYWFIQQFLNDQDCKLFTPTNQTPISQGNISIKLDPV
jgi:hypothetical protein